MGADGNASSSLAHAEALATHTPPQPPSPTYPPCGISFVQHLHSHPDSNHVHLTSAFKTKPKSLRPPFLRVSSNNRSNAVAPPGSSTAQTVVTSMSPSPPPSPPLPLHLTHDLVPPSSHRSAPSTRVQPRLHTRPQSAPVIRTALSTRAHSFAPGTIDDAMPAGNIPSDGHLTRSPQQLPSQPSLPVVVCSSSTGQAEPLAQEIGQQQSGCATGRLITTSTTAPSGSEPERADGPHLSSSPCSWDPPKHSTPPQPPNAFIEINPDITHSSFVTTTMSSDSVDSSQVPTPPTPPPYVERHQSLDSGRPGAQPPTFLRSSTALFDNNDDVSAATVRLASSNVDSIKPLIVPSPDRELMDPMASKFRLAPNPNKPKSNSDSPVQRTRPSEAEDPTSDFPYTCGIVREHFTPPIDRVSTGDTSPVGTPGDLSGLPPTITHKGRSVLPRIPAASAPLAKTEPIVTPNAGDYFGDAVVMADSEHVEARAEAPSEGAATYSSCTVLPPSPPDGEYPTLRHQSQVEAFYKQFGFVAAPPCPTEAKRLKALYNFNIMHTTNDVNFDRIVHMIKLVFKVKIGFITMVDSDRAWFKAKSGFDATQTSRSSSFCGHTILCEDEEPLVVLDTLKDWRFCNNPHVIGPPYVRFYAGAPLRTSTGYNVGSLCLVDDTPRPEFPPRSRHILKEFAAIVIREMELWRDRLQLRTRDKIQTSMEKFTRECLEIDEELSGTEPESTNGMNQVYSRAAKLITNTLELDGCTILDISQFERVDISTSDGERRTIYHANPYAEGEAQMVEPAGVFGPVSAFPVLATAPGDSVPTRQLTSFEHEKMSAFLADHRDGRIFEGVAPTWIKYVFPTTLKYGMVVPVIGIDKQPFALICAYTRDKGKQFLEGYELQFLRGIGVIILSAVLRRRMLLADRSKSVLISSVSHELRTPLHGILAASELLGDSNLDPNQDALLSTVRTCGLQLIETVNHVLDFTKLSGGSKHMPTKPHIKLSKCNLTDLIQQTVESCWLGVRGKSMQQGENTAGSFYAPIVQGLLPHEERVHVQHALAHVETVLDLAPREGGWNVICETGGLRRSLMNIYSNALKFTKDGYIQVVLRELSTSPGQGRISVQLAVIDTGKGIGKEFLKDQIFQPFCQENPLQPGTGLGLAIVNSIMRSEAIKGNVEVWSIEGEGTEVRLTFDVDVVEHPAHHVPLNRSIGTGLKVGFINYDPNHRGLQLSKEVMMRQAEYLGYTVVPDYRDADVLVMNELGGIAQDTIDLLRTHPLLLCVTFKIWSRDRLNELGLIKDKYVRVMCKPMVRYSMLYELERVGKYIRAGSKGDGSDLGELPSTFSEMALDSPNIFADTRGRPNSFAPQVTPEQRDPPVKTPTALTRRRSEEDSLEKRVVRPPPLPRAVTYHSSPGSRDSQSSPASSSEVTSPSSTISLADGGALLKAVTIPDELQPLKKRAPRVMVVEDNVINRRVLTAFLKKRGCEYAEAVDGSEGVKLFSSTEPNAWDIILMDINMPVMNGYDATRRIRSVELSRQHADAGGMPSPEVVDVPTNTLLAGMSANLTGSTCSQPNHSKIFALTGLATAEDKRQAFGSGVDGYLVKPVSLASLDMLFKKIGF